MPNYKYESAFDWLSLAVEARRVSSSELLTLIQDHVDGDAIQDMFQKDMEADGFFVDLEPAPPTWADAYKAHAGLFLQPYWYEGHYREVELDDYSTGIVPTDVCDSDDPEDFTDYCERPVAEVGERKKGFLCRLSASGYTDCTEWNAFATEQEAIQFFMDEAPERDTEGEE